MMMARMQRVKQWGLVTSVVMTMLSGTSFAQSGYSNPRYQGSAPKKGESVQLPSYAAPAPTHSGAHAPTYSTPSSDASAAAGETTHSEHSIELGINLQLPVGIGDAGGSLKPKFGGNAQVYFSPLISDDFDNYVSAGLDMFTLEADSDTKLNVLPFAFGLDFKRNPDKQFNPKFGIAAGGAYVWMGIPNAQTMSGRMYFLAQVKPGLDINMDGWSIVAQMPVSFLIGSSKMSYIAYSLGARFGI